MSRHLFSPDYHVVGKLHPNAAPASFHIQTMVATKGFRSLRDYPRLDLRSSYARRLGLLWNLGMALMTAMMMNGFHHRARLASQQ